MTARRLALPFWLAIGALLLWRPLQNGAAPADAARFGAFLALYVFAPGWLVQRRLREPGDDWLLDSGMAAALGSALLIAAYLVLGVLADEVLGRGVGDGLLRAYPLVFAPLLLLRRRPPRARAARPGAPGVAHAALLLLLLVAVVHRTHPRAPERWWWDLSPELLFHVGNAAELAQRWPLENPRVAGLPLNYHVFSYALPAAASRVTGIPVSELMVRLDPGLVPVLLAVQVHNAGALYAGRAAAGLVAAALVALHVDIGSEWARWAGLELGNAGFGSRLDFGIYRSTTTALGLLFFATFAIAVPRWLGASRGSPARRLLPLGLLAVAASGTKATVMPVVLAGLLGWVLVRRSSRRSGAPPAHLLFLFLLGLSLPMTLHLATGPGSFAPAMFLLRPGGTICTSGLFEAAGLGGEAVGERCPWPVVALAPLWAAGYLGLLGIPGLIRLARRRRRLSDAEGWLAGCALAGAALALLLIAPGGSQLFFLYGAQIGLAVLSGAALVRLPRQRGARGAAALAGVALLAAPLLSGSLREAGAELRQDAAVAAALPPRVAAYREGIDWIRGHSPADALLVVRHRGILVSALGERRVFYETESYSPQSYAAAGAGDPFARRIALRDRILRRPGAASLRALREIVPGAGPVYLVFDDVRFRRDANGIFSCEVAPAPDLPRAGPGAAPLEIAFANAAIRIARIAPREGPAAHGAAGSPKAVSSQLR